MEIGCVAGLVVSGCMEPTFVPTVLSNGSTGVPASGLVRRVLTVSKIPSAPASRPLSAPSMAAGMLVSPSWARATPVPMPLVPRPVSALAEAAPPAAKAAPADTVSPTRSSIRRRSALDALLAECACRACEAMATCRGR
ncbi:MULTISPECIES: hypothetical protein [Streptomyces]|uniref:hypothetical protein n=1 Tax=Streptomyces TaxID=1883 RepID=UPI00345B5F41